MAQNRRKSLRAFRRDFVDFHALQVHKVVFKAEGKEIERKHVHHQVRPIRMDQAACDDREVLLAVHKGMRTQHELFLQKLILKRRNARRDRCQHQERCNRAVDDFGNEDVHRLMVTFGERLEKGVNHLKSRLSAKFHGNRIRRLKIAVHFG